MPVSLQVIYPVSDGSHFDYDYYTGTHMPMVGEVWGDLIDRLLVTRGIAGGPDVPPGYHAVASIVFLDGDALQAAMGRAGPLLEDIPNFTNAQPQMLVGEVLA